MASGFYEQIAHAKLARIISIRAQRKQTYSILVRMMVLGNNINFKYSFAFLHLVKQWVQYTRLVIVCYLGERRSFQGSPQLEMVLQGS